MKIKLKKMVSFIMSAVMTVSALSLSSFRSFAETNDNTEQAFTTNDNDLQCTGLFGTMFSDEISNSNEENNEAKKADYGVYRIYHEYQMPFIGVEYHAISDCTLFVGFYNDEGTQLITSQTYDLTAATNGSAELTIADVLPESYLIKAFIVGKEFNNPLSSPYTYDKCTKKMQEIMSKTVDDFDEEKTVNLDNNDNNNFIVANDDTIIIESTDEKDTYIENNGSGTYEFRNADKTKKLKKGNKVLVKTPSDLFCFKVIKITETDGTVVITPDPKGLSPEETLEFVKFDASALDVADQIKLEYTENDDVEYVGTDIVDEDGNENTPSDPTVLKLPHTKSLLSLHKYHSVTFNLKKGGLEGEKNSLTFGGTITLFLNYDMELYFDHIGEDKYLSVFGTMETGFQFSIEGEYKHTFELPKIQFGFVAEFTIQPEIEISISAKFNWKVSKTYDIDYSSFSPFRITEREKEVTDARYPEWEVEGTITVNLKIGLELLIEDLLSVHITPNFGIHFTLTNADSTLPLNVRHDCKNCLSFTITPFVALSADITFLGDEHEADLAEFSWDAMEFHKSAGSGWQKGPCDNISHLITLHVIEEKDKDDPIEIPVEGAKAYIDGSVVKDPDDESKVLASDEKGNLSFYVKDKKLLDKNFAVDVQSADGSKFGRCAVGKKYVNSILVNNIITVEIGSAGKFNSIKDNEPEDNVCGHYNDEPSAWFKTYGDGTCYIWGMGYLNSIGNIPEDIRADIKKVYLSGTGLRIEESFENEYGPYTQTCCYFNYFPAVETIDLRNTSINRIPYYCVNNCSVKNIYLPSTVRIIGDHAFTHCTNLKEINLPYGVIEIEQNAFDYSGLTSFNCPKNLKVIQPFAFDSCKNMKEINFNYGLTHIGEFALGYTDLRSVNIPASVTEIGESAFYECRNLQTVVINNDFIVPQDSNSTPKPPNLMVYPYEYSKEAGYSEYIGTFTENNNSSNIFGSCNNLRQVIFNEGVTRINPNLFYGRFALISVKLPSTLRTIGQGSFVSTGLTHITLPENLNTIEDFAFEGSKLQHVNIPSSVTSIGHGAFGTDSLKSITINNPSCICSYSNGAASAMIHEGKDIIVYGHDGSTAEAFAKENGNTFISLDQKPTTQTTTSITTVTTTTTVTTAVSTVIGPQKECVFIAVKDATTTTQSVDQLLDVDNVAFFDQQTADEQGKVTFTFIPDALTEWTYIFISEIQNSKITQTIAAPGEDVQTTWYTVTDAAADHEVSLYGDTNCDGKVELADAILIMQALANPNKYGTSGTAERHLTEQGKLNGDVDKSVEGLTPNDALRIQEYLLGKIDSLPQY